MPYVTIALFIFEVIHNAEVCVQAITWTRKRAIACHHFIRCKRVQIMIVDRTQA